MNCISQLLDFQHHTASAQESDGWREGTGEEWKQHDDEERHVSAITVASLEAPGFAKKMEELVELFNETNYPNWGGEEEEAVSFDAILASMQALASTAHIQLPMIAASPKGCILLEWRSASGSSFVASFNRTKYYTYAGHFPGADPPGVALNEFMEGGPVVNQLLKMLQL